jgi:hypothetical protein
MVSWNALGMAQISCLLCLLAAQTSTHPSSAATQETPLGSHTGGCATPLQRESRWMRRLFWLNSEAWVMLRLLCFVFVFSAAASLHEVARRAALEHVATTDRQDLHQRFHSVVCLRTAPPCIRHRFVARCCVVCPRVCVCVSVWGSECVLFSLASGRFHGGQVTVSGKKSTG